MFCFQFFVFISLCANRVSLLSVCCLNLLWYFSQNFLENSLLFILTTDGILDQASSTLWDWQCYNNIDWSSKVHSTCENLLIDLKQINIKKKCFYEILTSTIRCSFEGFRLAQSLQCGMSIPPILWKKVPRDTLAAESRSNLWLPKSFRLWNVHFWLTPFTFNETTSINLDPLVKELLVGKQFGSIFSNGIFNTFNLYSNPHWWHNHYCS